MASQLHLDELSEQECLALLPTVAVGRLAITVDALPAVLPVNFAVTEGGIVIRTVVGTKLDAATAGVVVAFQADSYRDDDHTGWSVLVRGVAREITGPGELAVVRTLPLESWAWDGAADRFVRIETTMVTGRRIVRDSV